MVSSTASNNGHSGPLIVSLDVGSSSVRTFVYDQQGARVQELGAQRAYDMVTSPDGQVEIDPVQLRSLCAHCLSATHQQLAQQGHTVLAVAFTTFWHSFLGVDERNEPTTRILHLLDTRSEPQLAVLRGKLDLAAAYQRTGCPPHTSYWPSKLLWLAETQPDVLRRTKNWVAFSEFLYRSLLGTARSSVCMASGSGLWNQKLNQYDRDMLAVLPIQEDQLAEPDLMDEPVRGLQDPWRQQWPLFADIPWYPAYGDGACGNVGSGCTTSDRFALNVGTTGAMRAVVEATEVAVPQGLWCYRLDRSRYLLGGALSNAGKAFEWATETLLLPKDPAEREAAMAQEAACQHRLTILPLFAGERAPGWRSHARAAITGISLDTTPVQIARAMLESVALRFRQLYDLMAARLGEPASLVASGGALQHSPLWAQMMADALGRPIALPCEMEASSRGAALMILERERKISSIHAIHCQEQTTYQPNPATRAAYEEALQNQRALYEKLFNDSE